MTGARYVGDALMQRRAEQSLKRGKVGVATSIAGRSLGLGRAGLVEGGVVRIDISRAEQVDHTTRGEGSREDRDVCPGCVGGQSVYAVFPVAASRTGGGDGGLGPIGTKLGIAAGVRDDVSELESGRASNGVTVGQNGIALHDLSSPGVARDHDLGQPHEISRRPADDGARVESGPGLWVGLDRRWLLHGSLGLLTAAAVASWGGGTRDGLCERERDDQQRRQEQVGQKRDSSS